MCRRGTALSINQSINHSVNQVIISEGASGRDKGGTVIIVMWVGPGVCCFSSRFDRAKPVEWMGEWVSGWASR